MTAGRTLGLGLAIPLLMPWLAASLAAAQPGARSLVAERVRTLTRASPWTLVSTLPIGFRTFHPQGMVRIGDTFLVSSVDRDGRAGHLFKIDAGGGLVADIRLGEGDIYHPGGIDYDGQYIWVPVAEYRPDSHSIIYRVDPKTMKVDEVFRFADHIGAIVYNTDDRTLHGVSWGSRRFYRWTLGSDGKSPTPERRPSSCARSIPRTTWIIRTASTPAPAACCAPV